LAGFCHLHNHSEMSLLDGMSRIRDIPARARELGMEACALTDHGVLYGAVDFARACRAEGVKPIIGVEGYLARRTRHDMEPRLDDAPYHMLLLAESDEGYQKLVGAVSRAWTEGFYYRPRMDREILSGLGGGVIATSGCLSAEVPTLIRQGRMAEARQAVAFYRDVFGRENFFLEIMDHGLAEEALVVAGLLDLQKEFGLGLVATQDAHYLRQEDAEAHDVLLCIQTGKTLSQPDRMKYPNDLFYLRSPEEMAAIFREHPEALANTVEIARRCHAEPDRRGSYLPDFATPDGSPPGAYLRRLVEERLPARYPGPALDARERAEYELGIIEHMGFESYFLITSDFVDFARANGIAVGPGRGSAAGSLVAYVLGITDIDPIRYHLFFERFLNPERVTMPDIDIDFDYNRRDEVIAYVIERYGADRVSHIITFGTMAARAAMRDVARVLEMPYGEADRLAKMVPNELGITLERALENSPDLAAAVRTNPRVARTMALARAIEGMPRHASVHAAGIVIAPEPLTNLVPLQKMADGTVVTQFPMTTLEELGLLKMDFLGLRTLTVLEDTCRLVAEAGEGEVKLDEIPLDDPEAFGILARADTFGIFQMESQGMRQVLRDLAPSHIEDVIAAVSLYRPGPMENIPLFISQKRNGNVRYLHPDLEPILRDTYGVMVYQEQVMEVASTMAGYTLGQADLLRRAVGKKKAEILDAEREHFVEGCLAKGHSRQLALELFDLIYKFANYGFNRAHGAAYGLLAYQSAYLKAHHTAAYLAAHLSNSSGSAETIAQGLADAKAHDIAVLGPDVNASRPGFSVEGGKIRVGLTAVKGLGEESARQIADGAPYASFFAFLEAHPSLSRKALESLIRAGATDGFGTRRTLLEALPRLSDEAGRRHRQHLDGQLSLFGEGDLTPPEPVLGPSLPDDARGRLDGEREALGFFLSGHPLDAFTSTIAREGAVSATEIREMADGATVRVAGVVARVSHRTTRSGDPMSRLVLSDRTGEVAAVVFPKAMQRSRPFLEVGLAVLAEGRVDQQEDGAVLIIDAMEALEAGGRITLSELPEDRSKVVGILRAHPGRDEVFALVGGVPVPMHARVDAASALLIEALEAELGKGAITVELPLVAHPGEAP